MPKGRKWKKTLAREAAYELYRQTVLEEMTPIVRGQVEQATGHFAKVCVVEHTENGLRLRKVTDDLELEALLTAGAYRVVLAEPDGSMSRYLTDQVVGQSARRVEVSGPGGGPVQAQTTVVHELHPSAEPFPHA